MPQVNLQNLIWGVQIAGVVRSALELSLFDHLEAAPGSRADDVAAALSTDPRGTRILLDAASAVGLVSREADRYQLAASTAPYLVSHSAKYVGDMMQMLQTSVMWQGFEHFTAAVRAGGTTLDTHAEDPEFALWDSFAEHTLGLARRGGAGLAKLLAERVPADPSLQVLDLACGTGLYGRSVAEQFPHARVTFIDWARVLERTRKNVAELIAAERARLVGGDMFESDLGGPYDVVIASHVFHHFDDARSSQLLARLARATRPGGLIAIHDFVITHAPPAEDPGPYLFATAMLASTHHGDTYTSGRFVALLEGAGYGEIEERQVGRMPTRYLFAKRLVV